MLLETQSNHSKILEGLQYQTYEFDQHKPYNKNSIDSPKERLTPWNSQRSKLQFNKTKHKMQTSRRQIQTHRIQVRKKIFDFTSFSDFYKSPQSALQKGQNLLEKILDIQKIEKPQGTTKDRRMLPIVNNTFYDIEGALKNSLKEGRKRTKKNILRIGKKHLVQNINYDEIEMALFKKKQIQTRFDAFCKKMTGKMERNNIKNESSIDPAFFLKREKVKIINFPLKLDHSLDAKKENKVKSSINKKFFIRSRIMLQHQNLPNYQPLNEKKVSADFEQIINEQNQETILHSHKNKGRKLFTMALKL